MREETERLRISLVATKILATIALLAGMSASLAQEWPAKPIRFIVVTGPGGFPDLMSRLYADRLSASLGQPVIVVNRPGGGGNLAAGSVATAPADGYTMLLTGGPHIVNPTLLPNPGFDYDRDFAPVSLAASNALVLVATRSFKASNLRELMAMKNQPGISIAMFQVGTANHLGAEMLIQMTGVDMELIGYNSYAQILPDLTDGRLQLAIGAVGSLQGLLKNGAVKPLAVTESKRFPGLPDVPTMQEAGLPNYVVKTATFVLVRNGTPQPIIRRLSTEIRKAGSTPEMHDKLRAAAGEPVTSTPEELAEHIKEERARWSDVLKKAKVKQ